MASRDEIRALEEIAFRAWPAGEVRELGGWRLRHMRGVTRRGNSAWTGTCTDARPVAERFAATERFYATRGLEPLFQVSAASEPEGLDAELAERGYVLEAPVSFQTAELRPATAPAASDGTRARVAEGPEGAWVALATGGTRFARVPEVHAALVARLAGRAGFVLAEVDGRPAGSALAVHEDGWVGIAAMQVRPELRRRGAARAMLDAAATWAARRGAGGLYLQVERDNPAALAAYASAGFVERYGYHYRRAPARR